MKLFGSIECLRYTHIMDLTHLFLCQFGDLGIDNKWPQPIYVILIVSERGC
jgi:hypothetical protein